MPCVNRLAAHRDESLEFEAVIDFDMSSVRWELLAWTGCVMVAALVIHFALLKPFERRAKAELKRSQAQREKVGFLGEVSSASTSCLAMARLRDIPLVTSVATERIGGLMTRAEGHPILERAIRELGGAMSNLDAAVDGGDRNEVQAAKLGVVTACLVVEREVGNMLRET